jgi:hypothetical protein
MFGSDLLLERRLRNGAGRTAQAEMLSGKKGKWMSSSGGSEAQLSANAHVTWTITVRVMPDDEEPFEATVKMAFSMGGTPMYHSIIPVLYDPKDHSKVVYDKQASAKAREQRLAESHARVEQLRATAGELISQAVTAGTMTAETGVVRLGRLRDGGVITNAEFEARKQKILGE